jgi:hypothetical protein
VVLFAFAIIIPYFHKISQKTAAKRKIFFLQQRIGV